MVKSPRVVKSPRRKNAKIITKILKNGKITRGDFTTRGDFSKIAAAILKLYQSGTLGRLKVKINERRRCILLNP